MLGTWVLGATAVAQAGGAAGPPLEQAASAVAPARNDAPVVTAGDSPVGNAEREALRVESIRLDMHLNANTGAVTTRARMRVRNGGLSPLARVALQLSSSLQWQSARVVDASGAGTRLPVQQYRVTTDTDHTGAANELVLLLPKALDSGAELQLDLYYGGTLPASAERLVRLGAPEERARQADWDGASGEFVGLRGFGNVLWYPVSAPAALLADGEGFARAVNAERERTAATTLQLSLTVEHNGGALRTAWFLDRPATLHSALGPALQRREAGDSASSPAGASSAVSSNAGDHEAGQSVSAQGTADEADAEPVAIDTAQWEPVRLDGRPVSLFVAGEGVGEGEADAAAGSPGQVRLAGADPAVRQSYRDAAGKVSPLLKRWLPLRGAAPLTVLSLPSPGTQAFADGDLLVSPVHPGDTAALAEALVYPLAAAALPVDAPAWVREGVPEFLRLLFLEQTSGRDRMLAELSAALPALREAEAARGMDPLPLRRCVDPVCARGKAAYALVMLRELAGDAALQQALSATLLPRADAPDAANTTENGADAGRAMTRRFEAALTQSSGKDLGWFFADWFSADRGLPDLQIVQVAPRRVERGASTVTEPTSRGPVLGPVGAEPQAEADDPRRSSPTAASRNVTGLRDGSWLVAVEVQNNGDVAAEVPVTVRAAGLQNQLPLRVPAHGRATVRVPFEAAPEEVLVNDGTTPEQHGGVHHRSLR
ncbi:hypothetical protein [Terriglobus sp.]|uniref:hypothetical protein n=1 Tax=Terriglobus sp. TaxID=1889013 RepID=UPI003B0015AC